MTPERERIRPARRKAAPPTERKAGSSTSHYFDKQPDVASRPKEIPTRIQGIDFTFQTDNGVFSKGRIDFGSNLLIDAAAVDLKKAGIRKGRLLDIGCGYGPIGIALKRIFPAMEPTLSDVNERSLKLAKKNAEHNGVKAAAFVLSDAFSKLPGPFDIVVTNPPVRAGKATVHAFFEGAFERLVTGGRLYVVLQRKQGAPSATEKLEAIFGNCEAIEKDGGYRVLRCIKKDVTNGL
jgi:16S rRNA (guanine1207-N2)-methyltransferase